MHINDEYVEKADILDVAMPMYNLIEYSENYSDSSATLYQFNRDEPTDPVNNDNYQNIIFATAAAAGAANAGSTFGSKSFEYKFNLIGTRAVAGNNITNTEVQAAITGGVLAAGGVVNNVKIAVPLKCLSNFFRSLEMPLYNCKIHLELECSKDYVLSNVAGASKFIIKDTNLYVPVASLSKEDIKDFIEQQNKGFQRSIYWNEYSIKETNQNAYANVYKTFNVDPSFQGFNRLFVIAFRYDNTNINNYANRNNHKIYYLPRVDIKDYNAIIDGRNFYDNNINSDVEKYTELKKVMIGKGDDYTTGSLLDYDSFKKNYKLVAIDLSKQKELDADPRAIQEVQFKCKFDVESMIYIILEKSKETILEFYKGTVKVY